MGNILAITGSFPVPQKACVLGPGTCQGILDHRASTFGKKLGEHVDGVELLHGAMNSLRRKVQKVRGATCFRLEVLLCFLQLGSAIKHTYNESSFPHFALLLRCDRECKLGKESQLQESFGEPSFIGNFRTQSGQAQ
jgi:hypothetical protein